MALPLPHISIGSRKTSLIEVIHAHLSTHDVSVVRPSRRRSLGAPVDPSTIHHKPCTSPNTATTPIPPLVRELVIQLLRHLTCSPVPAAGRPRASSSITSRWCITASSSSPGSNTTQASSNRSSSSSSTWAPKPAAAVTSQLLLLRAQE